MPNVRRKCSQAFPNADANETEIRTLCLNSILTTEHIVNVREVVCARSDILKASCRLEVLLQMSLLAEQAHLYIC